MDKVTLMLMLKVGQFEHLESFRNGNVHFNPLSFFRNDSTTFRGDELEGTYIIDTSKGYFINGIDISKFGVGFRATQTYADSDSVLIFCAAILDSNNTQFIRPNSINLFDEFSASMREFGQYAVVFNGEKFLENIKIALKDVRCNSAWGKVEYCDKSNHGKVREYISKSEEKLGDAKIYFLKDELYSIQNEWRYVIDYIAPNTSLALNENGSLDLKIPMFPVSQIVDLDSAQKIPE